jgi:hypothetical protein
LKTEEKQKGKGRGKDGLGKVCRKDEGKRGEERKGKGRRKEK